MSKRNITTVADIKRTFAKCSPSEKKQILGYVGLKPRERQGHFWLFEDEIRYFLREMHDLDTGRKFMAAGLAIVGSQQEGVDGLTRPAMMEALGLEVPVVLVRAIAKCVAAEAEWVAAKAEAQRVLRPQRHKARVQVKQVVRGSLVKQVNRGAGALPAKRQKPKPIKRRS